MQLNIHLLAAFTVNVRGLSVLQPPEAFKRRGSMFTEIIDKEFDVELGWIGGTKANTTRKVSLNSGSQGNYSYFAYYHRFWELYQVQIDFLQTELK